MKHTATALLLLFVACTSSDRVEPAKSADETRSRPEQSVATSADAPRVAVQGQEAGVVGGVVGGVLGAPAATPPPANGAIYKMLAVSRADFDAPSPQYAQIKEHDYIRAADEKTTTFSIDVDGAS